MSIKFNIVILAAGRGTRMYSSIPKVLHKIGNKPMLQHVIETSKSISPQQLIVVYGHGGEQVKSLIAKNMYDTELIWCLQENQLGTGHALKCANEYLKQYDATLLLYGDVPLISQNTIKQMQDKFADNIVILTADFPNPTGYGRIIRNDVGKIIKIVEEKDANQEQRAIKEVNTGIYIFPNKYLSGWLEKLTNNNSQGEYYITDLLEMAYLDGVDISSVSCADVFEVMGVNNKLQLEYLERQYQLIQTDKLLNKGVTIIDKNRIDIRGEIKNGIDCFIDINCIFEGNVTLGNNVTIGANCIIKNSVIHDGVEIKPNSIIEDSEVFNNSQVGPYARLRPGSKLLNNTHIGNFVEIKKSIVGIGSKVNHLTYIGDATIGSNVNIGAGSITCNYDGMHKFNTNIGDNAFIGSGTMMVAPVKIGNGSIIGAGSVITKDTPENELTVSRAKQVTILGWVKKFRQKK